MSKQGGRPLAVLNFLEKSGAYETALRISIECGISQSEMPVLKSIMFRAVRNGQVERKENGRELNRKTGFLSPKGKPTYKFIQRESARESKPLGRRVGGGLYGMSADERRAMIREAYRLDNAYDLMLELGYEMVHIVGTDYATRWLS